MAANPTYYPQAGPALQGDWTDDQLNELMSSLSDNEVLFTSDSASSPVPIPSANEDVSYALAPADAPPPVFLDNGWAPRRRGAFSGPDDQLLSTSAPTPTLSPSNSSTCSSAFSSMHSAPDNCSNQTQMGYAISPPYPLSTRMCESPHSNYGSFPQSAEMHPNSMPQYSNAQYQYYAPQPVPISMPPASMPYPHSADQNVPSSWGRTPRMRSSSRASPYLGSQSPRKVSHLDLPPVPHYGNYDPAAARGRANTINTFDSQPNPMSAPAHIGGYPRPEVKRSKSTGAPPRYPSSVKAKRAQAAQQKKASLKATMAVAKLPSSGSSGQISPLPRTPSPTSATPPILASAASSSEAEEMAITSATPATPAEVSKAEAIAALNTLEAFLSKTVLDDRTADVKSSPSSTTKSTAEGEFHPSHRDLIRDLQSRLMART